MSSKVLYEYLQSVGCCETCVLRYFKAHVDEFLDIPKAFLSVSCFYLSHLLNV